MNEYLHSLVEKYIAKAIEFWPDITFGQSFSLYPGKSEATNCEFEFYNHQQALKKTDYYPNSNEFIHYTSIENLQNILNSGEIRLYNLHNLNDPSELKFMLSKFSHPDIERINELKGHFFIHSVCRYPSEDFEMWRKYGQEGRGAALVYEILNPEDKWYKFNLGKVQYGKTNDSFINFSSFIDFHSSFNNENRNPIKNIPEFLFALSLFHKKELWQPENEYRLITRVEFDKHTFQIENRTSQPFVSKTLKHFIKDSGKQVGYITMPLWKKDNLFFPNVKDEYREETLKIFPQIRIKKIILGFQVDKEICDKLFLLNYHRSLETFGYYIECRESELKDEFYR